MVMGTPRLKKKPIEYQYFPYLKKPSLLSPETSQEIDPPKHGTEIVSHRIHMAIKRLEFFENNRESIAKKISRKTQEFSDENDKAQEFMSSIPTLSPRE